MSAAALVAFEVASRAGMAMEAVGTTIGGADGAAVVDVARSCDNGCEGVGAGWVGPGGGGVGGAVGGAVGGVVGGAVGGAVAAVGFSGGGLDALITAAV